MEKIVINKEFLSGYKTLSIGFENCDDYKIDVADIVDVYCEVERIDGGRNEYRTRDGFIKISAFAGNFGRGPGNITVPYLPGIINLTFR